MLSVSFPVFSYTYLVSRVKLGRAQMATDSSETPTTLVSVQQLMASQVICCFCLAHYHAWGMLAYFTCLVIEKTKYC